MPVTATTATATAAVVLKRRTTPASASVSHLRPEGEDEGDEPAQPDGPGCEVYDIGGDHDPATAGRPRVPLDGEPGEGDDSERSRPPRRGSPVDEHGGHEEGVGRDDRGDTDRPAQRRQQHVVVAKGIEAAAEAGDTERHGGEQGDGTEHRRPARHCPQVGAAVGVHGEQQRPRRDEGAGVGDGRQGDGTGAHPPAGGVAAEVEGVTREARRGRRPDVEHGRSADAVRVDRDDLPHDGVRAVGEARGQRCRDHLVREGRVRHGVVALVVEDTNRPTGQRHRFAERQHDLGRSGVDDLAVRRRDGDQLGVGGDPASRQPGEERHAGGDGEPGTAQPLHLV